jgi:K+-transporting ATPase ATPase A chain
MLIGRFWLMIPVLALPGLCAEEAGFRKCRHAAHATRRFSCVFLVAVIMLVGALTFQSALALGPIAEHLARVR